MDQAVLVDPPIEAGQRLLESLDGAKLPIRVAFWLRDAEAREWRLVLASPLVDALGPTQVYRRLEQLLGAAARTVGVRLADITLVGMRHPLVQMWRGAIGTGKGTIGIRVSQRLVNGRYVDDAYIYRLDLPST